MNIIPFQFENKSIRVVTDDAGESWFVAADVCKTVGLQDHKGSYRHHLDKLDEDERHSVPRSVVQGTPTSNMGVVAKAFVEDAGGAVWAEPEIWLVSESGAYALILRSRDATTPGTVPHRFRRWITSEVLPSIRKTGSYSVAGNPNVPTKQYVDAAAAFIKHVTEDLKLAQSSVLGMYQKLEIKIGMQGLLPAYAVDASTSSVAGSSERTAAVGTLLKQFSVSMSAVAFNKLLVQEGFLAEHTRPSSNGGTKKFKVVTSLEYGKNITSPTNPRETQPHWYVDKFPDLLEEVLNVELA